MWWWFSTKVISFHQVRLKVRGSYLLLSESEQLIPDSVLSETAKMPINDRDTSNLYTSLKWGKLAFY